MKKTAILLSVALMFVGCAMDSKSKISEANMMQENLVVYGAYKAQLAGNITMKENDRCNKASFLLYARSQNMDKVVDVVMKETCSSEAGSAIQYCSCEYSGIGMQYKEMDTKEMLLWKTGESVKQEEETAVSDTSYAETSTPPDLSAEQMTP